MIEILRVLPDSDPWNVVASAAEYAIALDSAFIDLRMNDFEGFGLSFDDTGCDDEDCDADHSSASLVFNLADGCKAVICIPAEIMPKVTAMLNQAMADKFPQQMLDALDEAGTVIQHGPQEG